LIPRTCNLERGAENQSFGEFASSINTGVKEVFSSTCSQPAQNSKLHRSH
jgi:hypothetical protein